MWKAPIYRKSYKKRYGTRCFLRPSNNTYPICKNGKPYCKGIRAALYYIQMNKDKNLIRRAKTLKKKYCNNLKKPPSLF